MEISVIVDCSTKAGYGHLSRCLTLFNTLSKNTLTNIKFFVPNDCMVHSLIGKVKFTKIDFTKPNFVNSIKDNTPTDSLLVIDNYGVSEEDLEELTLSGYRVAMLEDGCRLNYYPVKLVIDSSPIAHNFPYKGLNITKFCLGPKYFPLREEFKKKNRTSPLAQETLRLLVTFGGSDENNFTERVFKIIDKSNKNLESTVLLGPFYKGSSAKFECTTSKIKVFRDPKNIAKIFGSVDLAISGAGNTALELAYLGIPSILIPLSMDQTPVAHGLSNMGAAKLLNPSGAGFESKLRNLISKLIVNKKERKNMSRLGKKTVDGNGADRIAKALLELS